MLNLDWKNEIIMIWGKTAAPSSTQLGGSLYSSDGNNKKLIENEIDSNIAFASRLKWKLSETLDPTNKTSTKQDPIKAHNILLDFIYAPGDQTGYYLANNSKRSKTIKAIALNPNYTPTLILFKQPTQLKKFNIDPAIASSVFVTTITDVIGFLSFLGIGAFFFYGT